MMGRMGRAYCSERTMVTPRRLISRAARTTSPCMCGERPSSGSSSSSSLGFATSAMPIATISFSPPLSIPAPPEAHQRREELVDLVDAPAELPGRAQVAAQPEVLLHGGVPEDRVSLPAQHHPPLDARPRREVPDLLAVEPDPPLDGDAHAAPALLALAEVEREPGDGVEQRGLAGA